MLRNMLVLTAALLAATACGPLSARPLVDRDVIERDSGQQLPEYRHQRQQRNQQRGTGYPRERPAKAPRPAACWGMFAHAPILHAYAGHGRVGGKRKRARGWHKQVSEGG